MKKRLLSIILLLFILILIPLKAIAIEDLNIKGKSAILMDVNTGKIIYKLKEHNRLPPASVTKIMTMLLGMEALESGRISLKDEVFVSNYASKTGGSTVFLEAGEKQTVENLFRAIAIRSANDASVALAEHIAGTEEIFVKMMNDRAKILGMENTHFENASGLPSPNHYLSSYDIALMSRELLKHSKVHEWLTIYMEEMAVGKKKTSIQMMVNTNRLIKDYEGATGIKTGSTIEAGHCLSASAKRGNLELIAVILGAKDSATRFEETKKMLDYGFATYESIKVGKKDDVLAVLPVEKGRELGVELILKEDSYLLLQKGIKSNIDKELIIPNFVDAPIMAGEEIGSLIISIDGKEVENIKLVAKSDVKKANLINIFSRTLKNYLKAR